MVKINQRNTFIVQRERYVRNNGFSDKSFVIKSHDVQIFSLRIL
jgi:hypothetical protein